ncbi:hypothetical protein MBLNU230_g6632t1 [Neophaeotheca triangularis]
MHRQQHPTLHSQRPPYPQAPHSSPQSAASSVFHSSDSLASINSMPLQQQPALGGASAPLPSPQQEMQRQQYFPSISSQQQQQDQQQQTQSQGQAQQFQGQVQQPQQYQSQQMGSRGAGFEGQTGQGEVPATAPFLKDFSLVAEAAKRAQMACLMRDMGECEL